MMIDSHDMRSLRDLADRDAIRDLVHRYCWAVDARDFAGVMALFDDECWLQISPGERHDGRAAVAAWFAGFLDRQVGLMRHLVHNQIVDLDGDTARSRTYLDGLGERDGESRIVGGYYDDRLVRRAGGWHFTGKIIAADFMVALHEGWAGKDLKPVGLYRT